MPLDKWPAALLICQVTWNKDRRNNWSVTLDIANSFLPLSKENYWDTSGHSYWSPRNTFIKMFRSLPSIVGHACNSSIWEAGAGGSWVCNLHSKILMGVGEESHTSVVQWMNDFTPRVHLTIPGNVFLVWCSQGLEDLPCCWHLVRRERFCNYESVPHPMSFPVQSINSASLQKPCYKSMRKRSIIQ